MGQISRQIESEQLAYEYALAQYREEGNLRMLRKLEAAPPSPEPPLPDAYRALRDLYMHDLGIRTTHEMKLVVTGIFLQSWRFREYTLEEKVDLWRGKIYSGSSRLGLWDAMLAEDLTRKITGLAVPVYFLHGIYDYTCDYSLAKAYFDSLKAPVKGFYTFGNSAHSPLFEEPDTALKIFLKDILERKTSLADRSDPGGV
jgi:pimeloyl-ACP methyl ester carboxylesterase